MREYLFRGAVMQDCETDNGQKLEKGQMVYGGLIQNVGIDTGYKYVYITTFVYTHEGCMECGLPVTEKVEVIPETVGEYIGLNDKNGVKIFNDDILRDNKGYIFRVFYNSAHCSYMTEDIPCNKKKRRGFGRIGSYSSLLIEVIGNIHDNSELLEVKTA